ncbi:MAG: aspartate carbamoyltransferase, partial [Planctomycetota bacterium]
DRVKLHFIAPEGMQMKQDILDHLDENGVSYELGSDPAKVYPDVDVVYQTRIIRDRLANSNVDVSQYNIDAKVLKKMKRNAILMHPLPRSVEIDPAVDKDARAAYFRHALSGLLVRMALLTMIFDSQ